MMTHHAPVTSQPMTLPNAPHEPHPRRRVDDARSISASRADPDRFRAVFERHHDVVHRYVASRVGSDAADDVVADTFLEAFRTRHRFDASRGTDARPWLLGIATRRIGRSRGGAARELRRIAELTRRGGAAFESEDHGARTIGRLDASRLGAALRAALDALRLQEREPLLLHVLGELTYEEVALALGIPVGTVRSRISRARARLVAALEEP